MTVEDGGSDDVGDDFDEHMQQDYAIEKCAGVVLKGVMG